MEETRQLLEAKVAALAAFRSAVTVLEPGMARAPLVDQASAQHAEEPRLQAVRERPEVVPSEAAQGAQVMAARAPSAARGTRREAAPEPSNPGSRLLETSWQCAHSQHLARERARCSRRQRLSLVHRF